MPDAWRLADTWRRILADPNKSWVAFENGTCVILMAPEIDLVAQAVALLKDHGPVMPGSSLGDFSTLVLDDGTGFVVGGHHNDILVFVATDEVDADPGGLPPDLFAGLLGRSKRDRDAAELRVAHVEDRRGPNPPLQRTGFAGR